MLRRTVGQYQRQILQIFFDMGSLPGISLQLVQIRPVTYTDHRDIGVFVNQRGQQMQMMAQNHIRAKIPDRLPGCRKKAPGPDFILCRGHIAKTKGIIRHQIRHAEQRLSVLLPRKPHRPARTPHIDRRVRFIQSVDGTLCMPVFPKLPDGRTHRRTGSCFFRMLSQ